MTILKSPKLIHYTEGGPGPKNYRNCEFPRIMEERTKINDGSVGSITLAF